MKSNGVDQRTLAVCFGQFGPYHHARVSALQRAAAEQGVRVVPIQIAAATTTYEWKTSGHGTTGPQDGWKSGGKNSAFCTLHSNLAHGLRTLCDGVEESASPLEVFLKARKLFREEKVDVAFLPSYSPARYFALFAAVKSLGIRTAMMNESHAGTEQATGWKRWSKRQIVKRFDAALVGGEPHKRHFASLGIPADKIFTGYDAVDNALFAAKADEVRSREHGARSLEQDESSKDQETKRQSVREAHGLPERYFLSLGRMVEKKNLATLVAAYAKFCDECRVTSDESLMQGQVALVFVGSGELEETLRQQARSLGLQVIDRSNWGAGPKTKRLKDEEPSLRDGAGRSRGQTEGPQNGTDDCKMNSENSVEKDRGAVYFYGFRQIEENPVFYALAEAFVLPSLKEEWGLVVNEAMAAGLPVIVSRTAGCAEDLVPEATASRSSQLAVGSIQSGEGKKTDDCELTTDDSLEQRSNGFVFDPTSSDALSEALRRIADQKTKRPKDQETDGLAEMGKRSREIVERFSCENFARQALRAVEAARA